MTDIPQMWADGTGLSLVIDSPHGPLMHESLAIVAMSRVINDGEILRFTWAWTDPETGKTRNGAGRLVYEDLPDPRAEVQPASPADATAQHRHVNVVEALTEAVTDMGTELFRNSGPVAPRPYTDGPPLPYGRGRACAKPIPERCGDGCKGCSYCLRSTSGDQDG